MTISGGGGSDTNADNGDDPAGGGGNSAPAGPWLCFTALTAGSSISTTNQWGTVANTPSLEYSTDGENWEPFTLNTGNDATNTTVTLANAGDKVYLRATSSNASFSESSAAICFVINDSVSASGNIMSLLDKNCGGISVPNFAFRYLFYHTALTTAPKLPATILGSYCYSGMFSTCSSLTTAPDLPATTLVESCYKEIFEGCTSLNSITVHFEEWTPANATEFWVYNVANSGQLHCPGALTDEVDYLEYSKKPEGWTKVPLP